MLELDDVHVAYGESRIIQGVSLRVGEREIVALLGRNGVGKTTLIRAICGLTPAKAGAIRYRQDDITRLPAHAIARRGVRLVPQGRRLFPSLDVREHLLVGARPRPGAACDLAHAPARGGRGPAGSRSSRASASACASAAPRSRAESKACWPAGGRSS